MARTLFDKLWSQHEVLTLGGSVSLIAIDRIFLHERTGSVALKSLRQAARPVVDPSRVFCTMDHIVDTLPGRGDDTRMPGGKAFIVETREAATEAGIRVFDVRDPQQGIVHVISPELGIVLPGATVVCPDSHTCTQGAMGALAWGIGSTEAEHALATGTLRVNRPKTMRVRFEGPLAPGVTAKDLTLALISRHGSVGGNGYAVEFAGSAVRSLEIEARLTLCNMATEFSAFTGMIAPDDKTFEYLRGRRYAPQGELFERAVAQWRELVTDEGARFDREITIDVGELAPMITWGTSPQHAVPVTGAVPTLEQSGTPREAYERALTYMGLEPGTRLDQLAIDAAFIGSCTNSRISDLRRAAKILEGRKVAPNVRAICVPGSMTVKRQAEAEGLDQVFRDAGFEWRESGCSMCFFAGGESFGTRERVVSSTNRNFESRQGPETRTHIASPETVAASAIAGRLADVREIAAAA
ncbi:MAG: 3-isopropylmalate dehydratase large subunit [Sinobacteraceae bacterium]|nr:3-isopropylmalate dehydratase large subunit [Nevskiaceae bacterium]MCP5359960.1 3-isopropylmalate dehydratase large subunit [Nevskiaceae bacterium]MCP5472221.1 3-isopropylmalate dehydratase large subunit [Nevskiaceae bacterium]